MIVLALVSICALFTFLKDRHNEKYYTKEKCFQNHALKTYRKDKVVFCALEQLGASGENFLSSDHVFPKDHQVA